MTFRFIYIIAFVFCGLSSIAQEYNYQHYDLTNGLSGLTVYSTVQDKNGYIWFGTETGLSRFDGAKFKNFTTADGLPDNEVLKLYVDSKERLWILSFTNALCYYKNGIIYTSKNDTLLKNLKFITEPQNVYEDASGNIIITESTIIHILSVDGAVNNINKYHGNVFYNTDIGINKKGNVVVSSLLRTGGDNWGLFEVNQLDKTVFYKKISDNSHFVSSLTFILKPKLFVYLRENSICINTNNTNDTTIISRPDNFIGFSYINDTLFTMNCSNKVYLYNSKTNEVSQTFSIGKIVNSCFKDSEGSYWFATTGYGVYRLTSMAFRNYTLIWNNNVLPVYSLEKKDSILFAGTNNALLWKINLNKNIVTPIRFNVAYGEGRVNNILLNDKTIIVGIDGVHYLSPNGQINKTQGAMSVKKIADAGNSLLVSTNRSVVLIDKSKPVIKDTLWYKRATCAYKFGKDYFIGTLNGLYKIDTSGKTINLGEQEPLLSSRISGIEKQNDILWIITYGNGVIGYSNNKVIKHITEQNGLSSSMCRSLALAGNLLWVGTDKGLNKILLNDTIATFTRYSSNSGLNCDIVNSIYSEDGSVYVGTPYGVTIFKPGEVIDTSIAILNIEKIESKKKEWKTFEKDIKLEAGDNRLYIEYACVSFKSQGNITYYYQLEGTDKIWHTTKENSLEFASLSSGNYTFHIYAINAFGKKSNEIILTLSIDKFFYQENWFFLVMVVLLSYTGWYLITKRIKKIKKDEQEKVITQKKLAELEQMAFRAQMNPHFIFNCLNSIQQYIFTKDVLDANIFITEFASLIRQTLDISVKKIITLEEEIKYISTYLKLEHTRFDGNFDYTISLAPALTAETTYLPPLLLQPFIENSIRHGIRNLQSKKGEINIIFSTENDFLFCIIEDNGIGRAASANMKSFNKNEHQSKGILLIEKRIEALNTDNERKILLLVEDLFPKEVYKGTKVILKIPL